MQAHDILGMPLENPQTLSRPPIPHSQRLVRATRDQHGLVELQRLDRTGMTYESPDDFARIEVPYLDGLVIRPGNQDGVRRSGQVVLDLKAHNPISMSLEDPFDWTSFSPITFNHETFTVDVFPGFPAGSSRLRRRWWCQGGPRTCRQTRRRRGRGRGGHSDRTIQPDIADLAI